MQVLARRGWVLCLGFLLLLLPFEVARAQLESPPAPLIAARQAILTGHVKAGLAEAEAYFRQAHPEQAAEYWAAGSFLIDYLISLQEYAAASAILTKMITDEIWKRDRFYLAQIQSYAAHLAAFGQIDKSVLQQLGRVLNGLPARDVFTAAQRRAAVAAAKVDLDSGNVKSAAIWLRRSIVAALSDQNLSGEEVVDLLTFYAKFLSTTRRFMLANKLYLELSGLYELLYPRLSPKRLSFLCDFLIFANDSGNYKLANSIFDILKSDVAQTDLAPAVIRLELPFQQIFRGLRSDIEADQEMAKRDLREGIDPSKVGEMASWSRIAHAYLAMLAGDDNLVDLLVPDAIDAGEGDQIAAYKLSIQALKRSRSSDLGESFALAKSAAQALGRMFASYELESAGVLPTLTAPERLVLGTLTFALARGINSEEKADVVSLLQQLLVRDKSTLGLQIRLIASAEDSDLMKEQVLGFERAKEARDALVSDAIEELIVYVKTSSKGVPRQDFNQLVRLQQLEGYIDRKGRSLEQLGLFRARAYPSISALQLHLKPEEAVVTHTLAFDGFMTYSCITSSGWEFKTARYSKEEVRQIASDEKLVNAAVRGTHSPSESADATFPVDSAYRLYLLLFQPIEGCIGKKKAITLATDPDLFFLPWNALVTRQPPDNGLVRLKDVNWLVKSHAISIEPSIASFVALRSRKDITAAGARYFLGVGDPQFSREERIAQLSPKPLFVSRGRVDATSIGSLQRLPETRKEIISEAAMFPADKAVVLVGDAATERAVRQQRLSDFQIITFATHAVVPDEIDGVSEPAVILTPGPESNNPLNDGALTASEIASLPLDANVIVLSACNTAGPDNRRSGRALSGLADAFFYAGSRSIVATQWSVQSEAAALISQAFVKDVVTQTQVGVAINLQATLNNFISEARHDYLAHPRFWAAFLVAGDGATRGITSESAGRDSGNPREWTSSRDDLRELLDFAEVSKGEFLGVGMYHPKASPIASTYLLPFSATIEAGEASNLSLAAGRIFSYGELGIQFLSSYEASGHPRSIFVKLASGKEVWRYVEASRSSLPIGFAQLEDARNFAVSAISSEDIHQPSDLRITELDDNGNVRRSTTFPLSGYYSFGPGSSMRVGDSLLVAIPVHRTEVPAQTINPSTGSRSVCWGLDDTELIRIDLQHLTLIKRSTFKSARATQIREVKGHSFLSFVRDKHCTSISSGIVEIPEDLEIRGELEAVISDVEVLDFARAGESWIVGGRARRNVFALKAPANSTSPPDIWSEDIWERGGEAVWNGFVATIRDNKIMTSKIFYDPRGGVVSRIISKENSIVLGGGIAGDRVWLTEMSIQFSRPQQTKLNK